ncbi:sensor domain-containing protein (plasmid) [Mycolicibacterium crocinum]|uniref:Sensor domain-containing protein n=1 Tax=Mycolicibacterium crocinum TaxID=388459 RepID=A0ABY3TTJ4_9MYCO|nr:sensor domain-containing protein [Mycolicibacterium crocinum]ULN44684.1 sensor domain-containing protein [Mycolicibacterium crocinum]
MLLHLKLKHLRSRAGAVRDVPRRLVSIGAFASVAVALAVAAGTPGAQAAVWGGVAAFTDGSGTPNGSPSTVGPFSSADLAASLLSAEQAAAITGSSRSMQVRGPSAGFLNTAKDISDPHCASPWGPGEAASYTDDAYTGVAVGTASDSGAHPDHTLTQAVIGFADEGSRRRYESRIAREWRECATRAITYTPADNPTAPQTWRFGTADSNPERTMMIMSQDVSGADWGCERGHASTTSNIAIDVLVCGRDPKGQASQAIQTITSQVPA